MRAFDHPLRNLLHEEVHARPPVALWPKDRLISQSFLLDAKARQKQIEWIKGLIKALHIPSDDAHDQSFKILELSPAPHRVVIKWELHGEFSSISAIVQQDSNLSAPHITSRPILEEKIQGLLSALNISPIEASGGLRIAALDIAFEDRDVIANAEDVSDIFNGNTLLGSFILSTQKAQMWTDLQMNDDGFISYIVAHQGLGSRQAGRVARRIIEAETYRMAAMLSFPIAKQLSSPLKIAESELADLSKEISLLQKDPNIQTEKDGQFLSDLSQLASRTEEWISEYGLRFTASEAYSQLLEKNLTELNETPIQGVQTLAEFMDRRFQPAMRTCLWTQRRLKELSDRISRTTQTLRTRIEFINEEQTQALLASMDKRAKLQLRLQETVEGLSVLVLTYYAVSLLVYIAKGGKEAGLAISPEIIAAFAAPIIAALLYFVNKRRARHH
jgi:uncharacterized membrane-anchored protein